MPSLGVENQVTSIGTTGPLFPELTHSHIPTIHLQLQPSAGNLVN